ncbi:MAG TPA: Dyp-type peroxidase domain-containing protein, partial [Acidimicrobiales bacterium]|nr:Dyp-type peroxidase domain-containing protein [Acidimicrobiales bacterium]
MLTPLTASAVFLVLTVDSGGAPVVRDLLADLSGRARTVSFRSSQGGLAVVAGVGSAAWDRLFAGPRPAELHPTATDARHVLERDRLGEPVKKALVVTEDARSDGVCSICFASQH